MFNLATQPFGPTKGEYYRLYVVELIVNGRIAESQKIIVKHEG